MITKFKHKGLRAFFESDTLKGIQPTHQQRLRLLLNALNGARTLGDLNRPGFALHPLQGKLKVRWSLRVRANWRLTFEFEDGNVVDLDDEDYH
ncbi:type II toxin-antitoxin system RelE/ParE family toxin [Pseudoduganella sp. GCM10020061]|uniref:type II toxin-antitoxin system RelE/ParE family toxin n=1 Tax=Pseudoduganella sp. GCM10020061 TaxID=3317345 RepID=UPI0036346C98